MSASVTTVFVGPLLRRTLPGMAGTAVEVIGGAGLAWVGWSREGAAAGLALGVGVGLVIDGVLGLVAGKGA